MMIFPDFRSISMQMNMHRTTFHSSLAVWEKFEYYPDLEKTSRFHVRCCAML